MSVLLLISFLLVKRRRYLARKRLRRKNEMEKKMLDAGYDPVLLATNVNWTYHW